MDITSGRTRLSDMKPEDCKKFLQTFDNNINSVSEIVSKLMKHKFSSSEVEEEAETYLFFSYFLNSMYWILLKLYGADPSSTLVKNELNRLQGYLTEFKIAQERKTIRPKINTEVAKRFVKHGISNPISNEVTGKRTVFK